LSLIQSPAKAQEFRTLPAPLQGRATAAAEEEPKTDTRALRGKVEGTVLVVDDRGFRCARSLSACCATSATASVRPRIGEEAITILRTSSLPIDAMLMDVYMPSFPVATPSSSCAPCGIDVPVIVCSGFMVEAAEFNALSQAAAGLVDVVQKPYSMETLASVIGKAV